MKKIHRDIILIVIFLIMLFGIGAYFTFYRKPSSVLESNFIQTQNLESEIITTLKTNWPSIQALIPFRPSYDNQQKNKEGMWQIPYIIQFIGKDSILVEFEDDNTTHVVVLHFDGTKFGLLEFFNNQYNFTLSDYQNLTKKYGDPTYNVSTYTIGLVRNRETIIFPDLTKVPENIFMKGYSVKNSS